MSNLSEQIKAALSEEGAYLQNSISESISANGQRASGRTQASLRFDVEGNTLYVSALNNIFSLEDGVYKNHVAGLSKGYFARKIYEWSIEKGIVFSSEKDRKTFSYRVQNSIRESGSKLFRNGGRKDVYTDKMNISVQRLSDRLGDVIINYKILK